MPVIPELGREISEAAKHAATSPQMTKELFAALEVHVDTLTHSAALNMAIDEALLDHATVPSIRFYRWHSPALSFGYFGRFSDVAAYAPQRDLVRRWTGGGIVFHGDDLTYSIVIPANHTAFAESSASIYDKVHRALVSAFIAIGKRAVVAGGIDAGGITLGMRVGISAGYSCFANPVRADVLINDRKVAGAAQRRTARGLLQQGSIQGFDIGNGLADRFAEQLSHNCEQRKLPDAVQCRALEIATRKYCTDVWLRKR